MLPPIIGPPRPPPGPPLPDDGPVFLAVSPAFWSLPAPCEFAARLFASPPKPNVRLILKFTETLPGLLPKFLGMMSLLVLPLRLIPSHRLGLTVQ